jgi:hypothetical protein
MPRSSLHNWTVGNVGKETEYLPLYARTPGHGCGPQDGEQCRSPVLTVGHVGEEGGRLLLPGRSPDMPVPGHS